MNIFLIEIYIIYVEDVSIEGFIIITFIKILSFRNGNAK